MLSVVIQAGGESRRMGQDKGLISFLGQPLITRVIQRVSPLASELIITTNKPEDYQFLGYPLAQDVEAGRGALGGVYTALMSAHNTLVAIVACDMPFVNMGLLAAERDVLSDPAFDLAIPHNGDGLEPFHAVYRRETCLPAIETALRADKWRVDAWFHQVKIHMLRKDEIQTYDPEMLCFKNINTPEELQMAEQLAANMDN